MAQSRLLSTTGVAIGKLYLCQIDFSDVSYTTVTSTICRDYSNPVAWKQYGTGIKYDPIF